MLGGILWRVAACGLVLAAVPGQFVSRSITSDDGLPQNTVNCAIQDELGFLVFGTKRGVAYFDGTHFEVYRHDPDDDNSLGSDNIWAIAERSAGELWVGGPQGLSVIDRGTGRIRRIGTGSDRDQGLRHRAIYTLYRDRAGTLWIGGVGGLHFVDPDEARLRRVDGPLGRHTITQIRAAEDDGLWLTTMAHGLHRYDPNTGESQAYVHDPEDERSLSSNRVWAVLETRDGTVWAGTNLGLNRLDRQSGGWERFRHVPGDDDSLGADWIWQLLEDSRGNLWVGTRNGGLDRWLPEVRRFEHYRHDEGTPQSLINDRISCLLEERNGRIWIGTQGGISIIDRRRTVFATARHDPRDPDSLPENTVWGITEASDGRLWIGTYLGILVRDPRGDRTVRYSHDPADETSLSSDAVFHFAEDGDGRMWVGTAAGLNRFEPETGTFTRFQHNPDDPASIAPGTIYRLHIDRRGRLWVTAGTGLDLHLGGGRFEHHVHDRDDPRSIPRGPLFALAEDDEGRLLVGAAGGLARLDSDGSFQRFGDGTGLEPLGYSISSIYRARDGSFWIGTPRGLGVTDAKFSSLTWLDERNGLPNPVVNSILEGPSGDMWAATNWGLARIRGTAGNQSVFCYTKNDQLQGNEFNLGSAYRDSRGVMHFGGLAGMSSFRPEEVPPPAPDPVTITDVRLLDHRIKGEANVGRSILDSRAPYHAHLELQPSDRVVTFHFAVLQFESPNRCRYEYRLTGLEDDWISAGSRDFVTYTNLPPGDYEFHVRGRNNRGVWATALNAIALTVHPPWWQTWWFRVPALIAAAAGLMGLLRFRTHTLRRRNTALARHVDARTQELSATVRSLEAEIENSGQLRDELDRARQMEAFGVIAAGVAHDLNNVLSGIVTQPDLMLTGMAEEDPLRREITDIRNAGRRAATIVRDLQSMSRRNPPTRLVLDFNALVGEYTESAEFRRLVAERPDVAISFDLTPAATPIEAAGDHLMRVLNNLILNGVECQPDGGSLEVVTRIETLEEPLQRYEQIAAGSYVVLTVRDRGTGIEPADRRRLFEPFFTRKKPGRSGTGLGLTIVWNTVHEHDGFIDVDSTSGGTTISLYLPRGTSMPASDANEPAMPRGNEETVLVVDDEPEQRRLAASALQQLGYRVETAVSGEAAIERTNEATFDLMVLDVRLEGGISGIDAFRRIREIRPAARAILASAHAEDGEISEAVELGVAMYVDKPYTVAELARAVHRGLSQRS